MVLCGVFFVSQWFRFVKGCLALQAQRSLERLAKTIE